LPRTKDISSTDLRKKLQNVSEINVQDINKAFEILQKLKHDFD